ncbi:hypothetical protein M422DRAFT_194597 [Sphaerobolus stellatus SS14]|uniref:CxC1-like cysteine cluster associated with KDZ transposases domain-containing protein n=1 Tax=Sphaerobolus stellatus (strain SS14) TaxID=990650 RepID=A0A0C9TRL9_SPHS4|nr:hypothetical protein M422DRAFT_194597 [Sphaerobolus stellatus SS14]
MLGLEETRLRYCKCQPAAVTLLEHGMFPCSPVQPSIAFDTKLLELVSLTMLNLALNVMVGHWQWKLFGQVGVTLWAFECVQHVLHMLGSFSSYFTTGSLTQTLFKCFAMV